MRISCLALVFGLLLGPGPVAAAAARTPVATPVLLKKSVVIEGAVLRLGDLFEGLAEAADTAIARAPAPGRRVELDARWLAAVATGYGIDWRPASALDSVVVRRASQVIDSARIEAALRDALAERGVTGDLSIVLDNPALSLNLPLDAAPSLGFAGLAHDPASGRFTAHLMAPAGTAPLARATVTGRVVRMVEVPVLRRRAMPGEVIARGDIDWQRRRADRLAGNLVLDPGRLVGKSPRRAIRAGEAVRAGDLREPVLVPRKSLVILRLETDRMVLTAQGRALEEGAGGQVIRVMNTKSNTVVNGVVVAAGTVRVLPAGAAIRN
jgi:flagella basal body P-ring formation protein FlgA